MPSSGTLSEFQVNVQLHEKNGVPATATLIGLEFW